MLKRRIASIYSIINWQYCTTRVSKNYIDIGIDQGLNEQISTCFQLSCITRFSLCFFFTLFRLCFQLSSSLYVIIFSMKACKQYERRYINEQTIFYYSLMILLITFLEIKKLFSP